jgi:hypothetical protein
MDKDKPIHPYVIVENYLSKRECNNIIKLGNKKPAMTEQFGEDEGRYSHVAEFTPCMFTDPEQEYYHRIHSRLFLLNGWHYGYKLSSVKKWLHGNFLRYDKGGLTAWHMDGYYGTEYPDRKLSAVIMLSDGEKDYKGGDFELPFYSNIHPLDKIKLRRKGTLIMFPSHMYHQVTKVTEGTRYTLAYFLSGPRFK